MTKKKKGKNSLTEGFPLSNFLFPLFVIGRSSK